MHTAWNKEQAQLLHRIALAGGACLADECQDPAVDALISAGFVLLQYDDRVALTDAVWAHARALRSRRPF